MKKALHALCMYLLLSSANGMAQNQVEPRDSSKSKLNFEAYLDFNYSYDFNRPSNRIRPFNSNPLYVNQVSLAYAYVQANFSSKRVGITIAFHAGGIADVMYAGEDGVIKAIREFSVRYRINKSMEVEAGIFPAIYGAETFINKDNLHAARAIMTDFAPDFEAGVRLKYRYSRYWRAVYEVVNGWQVIRENNNSPAFGMVQIFEKPNRLMLNYGMFIGNEVYKSKEAMNQLKLYNNFFARIYVGKKWILAPMIDVGFIRNPLTFNMDQWTAFGGSVRYAIASEWAVAFRYEMVHDPNQIINELITNTANGFQVQDGTLTVEYLPAKQVTLRLEGRYSVSPDAIYDTGDNLKSCNDLFIMAAVAIQMKDMPHTLKRSR